MPLEPLDTHFVEPVSYSVRVHIEGGRVTIFDAEMEQSITITEDEFGKLMDKWMLARLAMNQRKTEGRYEKSD